MRRWVVLALVVGPTLWADEVPQAVKALAHLRPQPAAGPVSWTAGPYQYDGSGNIAATGSEAFVYDKIGRLKSATLRGPGLSAMQTQTFTYDEYGNLTATSKLGQTVILPASVITNRREDLGYDASGNVITSGAQTYSYDAVEMLNTVLINGSLEPRIIYAYTADDERLFSYDVSTGTTHWTLRGFDNKVLRDFKQTGANWSVERDCVYRDGLLLAALRPGGAVEHYSLDHLGTPCFITDGAGHEIGYHVYWPYGEEWTSGSAQEANPLQFTGHERDADPSDGAAGLDYMHARYYRAGWGRFAAADPVLDVKTAMARPQGWNRYSYVRNNPLRFTDPDGRLVELPQTCSAPAGCKEIRDIRNGLPPELRLLVRATRLADGRVVLNSRLLNAAADKATGNFAALRSVANAAQTVFLTTSVSQHYEFVHGKVQAGAYTATDGNLGQTVPSALSGFTRTLVSVNPAQSAREAAITTAHELYGHALRFISGQSYMHSQVPSSIFSSIEAEAGTNYDHLP